MRWFAGVTIAVVISGACSVETRSSPPTATLTPLQAEQHTLRWAGEDRTYLLHRPAGIKGGPPPALVVVLHGASLTAGQTERYYHFDDVADAQGFVVVYPQGLGRAWNAGSCCSEAPGLGTDDVGFIGALLDEASRLVGADRQRLYLTGVSNGAMMTLRFECERAGRLAAIGSVAGTFTSPCDHPPPVPFIEIHGLNDRAVRFTVGPGTSESGPAMRLPAVETIGRFLKADGCHDPMTVTSGVVHTETATCAPGLDVKVVTIDGAGHQWPGATLDAERRALDGPADQPSTAVDATRELWTFFSAHVLR